MAVVNAQEGAVGHDGIAVVARVDDGPVRLAVADNAGMTGPVFFGPESVDAQGVVKIAAAGLDPLTRYWWQLEDNGVLDTAITGTFRTVPRPGERASFIFGGATCAGAGPSTPGVGDVLASNRLSDSPVFDVIRQRALAENWAFFWHGGDRDYYDLGSDLHGIGGGASLANYRRAVDDVLTQPRQAALYRAVPIVHAYDDHDFGPNNSDRTHTGRDNRLQVYREREPHYPLADPAVDAGIYHPFRMGRVLFAVADVRADRDPNADPQDPGKTMLGAAQKAWLEQLLATADDDLFVWLMPDQWTRTTTESLGDHWGAFAHERAELVEMFGDLGWLDRMMIIQGDSHNLGFNSGRHPYGRMPVYQVAPLDSGPSGGAPALWDVGLSGNVRGQYGRFRVDDHGNQIVVTATGFTMDTQRLLHQWGTPIQTTPALIRTLPGSHDDTFDARVLDGFQTGPDPDGTTIPILGGSVFYDGTAKVLGSLNLRTEGVDERGGSLFPRGPSSLLDPFGTEVFVRRGVDFGTHIEWFPLGVFRIITDEQDTPAYGPIDLTCQDRMSGIEEARLLAPRGYEQGSRIGDVVDDLVRDVYPHAVIWFDDDTDDVTLGRQFVVERERDKGLRDLAAATGKRVFWDGQGRLVFASYPDPDEIAWDVHAGTGGVLVEPRRRVTRQGVNNAVVATGEGGDTNEPVQGIAVDANPNSPTYFHGENRFGKVYGKVPRFYSSPLLTTPTQARLAASTILRRSLGAPHAVNFGSVVNPALRPFDHVRVRYNDGNRERHILDVVEIPLSAAQPMTSSTRESTLIEIGVS